MILFSFVKNKYVADGVEINAFNSGFCAMKLMDEVMTIREGKKWEDYSK